MSVLHLIIGLLVLQVVAANILVIPVDGVFVQEELRDMTAAFGALLPYEGMQGYVLPRGDACTDIEPPPAEPNRYKNWIALVARFNCTFETKVRNAQRAQFNAVIVHNVGSDSLEIMSASNGTGINIPAVFVGVTSANLLTTMFPYPEYYVIVNSETPFNITTHLLLPFAIVVGVCFLVMLVFMVVKFIRDNQRQRRERLSKSALNKIPIRKFEKGDPYETCAICLDDYIEGEKLRILPCAHAYHAKCIDPWLTKNKRVCPVCKRKVFAYDEHPYAHDSDSDAETDDTTPLLRGGATQQRVTQGGTFEQQPIEAVTASSEHVVPEVVTTHPRRNFLQRLVAGWRRRRASSDEDDEDDTTASGSSLEDSLPSGSGQPPRILSSVEHSINNDSRSSGGHGHPETGSGGELIV